MVEVVRELLPFAVALYLFDAMAWVSEREVVFASLLGRDYRIRRRGLNLVGLLSTAVDLRVCANRPLVTPRAVLLPPSGPVTPGALTDPAAYGVVELADAASAVVDHTTVRFPGGRAWKAPSAAVARSVHGLILELSVHPPGDREARIRAEQERAFDHRGVGRRLEAFLTAVDPLFPLNDALFALVFLVLPVCAVLAGSGPALVGAVSLLTAALWAVTAAATFRLARRLDAQGLLRPDMTRLITVLLPPPIAFRGVQALAADILPDVEPAAVAAHLLSDDRLRPLLRAEVAAVARALAADGTEEWRWAWSRRDAALRGLLDRLNLSEDDLAAPVGAGVGGICPACAAAYRPGFDRCSDCGVALI
jgi:hypothetical protein